MKQILLSFSLCFLTLQGFAQHSFMGIQNSPRKGMVHAAMNPAELNNLSRKVEVNLFSVGATANNNVLTFKDIIKEEDDYLDLVFDRMDGPVTVNSETQVMGPSFGFTVNKWSFGIITQAFVKGDVMGLDAELSRAFQDGELADQYYDLSIHSTSNQRVNVAGWAEIGVLAGREIWSNDVHTFSAGGNFKLLIPGAYMNLGLDNLQGTLTRSADEFSLTDAKGRLNLSYPPELEDWDIVEQNIRRYRLKNISGIALDLGISHQWMKNGVAKFSSGFSLKNMGRLNLAPTQVNNSYQMNIPAGEYFRLDQLEGELEEIEQELLSSGYFTKSNRRAKASPGLPTTLVAYTDMRVSRIFQVSVFGQYRVADNTNNRQISSQNVIAVTPRLTLGNFEIYSPWANYEVSGLTGGAGLRLGSFFIGSQSVVTGLLADSKQVDLHMGLSLGFGDRTPKSNYNVNY